MSHSSSGLSEQKAIEEFRQANYPRPAVTVDIVVLTILDADLKVLLIRRKEHPFQGAWALPGGFLRVGAEPEEQGEDLEEAAQRELEEETGLPRDALFLEQLGAFGKAGRDPRLRVVTVAYYSLVRPDLAPFVKAGTDAAAAGWRSLTELSEISLAFDHQEILQCALERIRSKLESSNIAFELVPETFSVAELRAVYEVIQGVPYDPANFRRRFKAMEGQGILEQAPGKRITGKRKARVYRFVRQDSETISGAVD